MAKVLLMLLMNIIVWARVRWASLVATSASLIGLVATSCSKKGLFTITTNDG